MYSQIKTIDFWYNTIGSQTMYSFTSRSTKGKERDQRLKKKKKKKKKKEGKALLNANRHLLSFNVLIPQCINHAIVQFNGAEKAVIKYVTVVRIISNPHHIVVRTISNPHHDVVRISTSYKKAFFLTPPQSGHTLFWL